MKPPRRAGKRVPIHRETHDVIRQWQQVKTDCGVESQWLFPSSRYRHRDDPYRSGDLNTRLRELVTAVLAHAPYPGWVEGSEGNLIDYDLRTIDAYALRHAYAQRYADATDADGRSTTPPDVLQALMDHKSFATTMTYYEVGAKRRKKALAAIAPRRIDSTGNVVDVNPDRDGFTQSPSLDTANRRTSRWEVTGACSTTPAKPVRSSGSILSNARAWSPSGSI